MAPLGSRDAPEIMSLQKCPGCPRMSQTLCAQLWDRVGGGIKRQRVTMVIAVWRLRA